MINTPTFEQLRKIPPIFSTQHVPLEFKQVFIHFSILNSHFLGCEFDGVDTFFGYVLYNGDLHGKGALGYFSLSELQELRAGGLLEVENDPFWEVRSLEDIELVQEIRSFNRNTESRMAPQYIL